MSQQQQHTVVALFSSKSDAREAERDLLASGFTSNAIDISTTGDVSDRGSADGRANDGANDGADDHRGSGVGNFFKSLFSGDEADTYAEVAHHSDAVVTVHAASQAEAQRAAAILDQRGAIDIDERAAALGGAGTDSVKVIKEDLQVGKRTVETGGARLRSRIVERPVAESVRLREERVRVERTPVNRVATPDDLRAFQNSEVELVEHAEVPVVSKQARVVEEISLHKEAVDRTEVVKDTVRETKVEVDDLADTRTTSGAPVTPPTPRR